MKEPREEPRGERWSPPTREEPRKEFGRTLGRLPTREEPREEREGPRRPEGEGPSQHEMEQREMDKQYQLSYPGCRKVGRKLRDHATETHLHPVLGR
jgi:hypothetical protein